MCDETERQCLAVDCGDPDRDGDGHAHRGCGGDDCDDADPQRFPGNTEICDAAHVDEDCDPTTVGGVDVDGDGHASAECCNDVGGAPSCGDDCDDMEPMAYAGATEACSGFDSDCDGNVDEGVTRTFFPDCDGDGYGDGTRISRFACNPADIADTCDWVENRTDCDDENRNVNPAASDTCDGTDNDCDGMTDEGADTFYYPDLDGDGYGDPAGGVRACERPARHVEDNQDCDDGDSESNPAAAETCDGRDDDCDGGVDEALARCALQIVHTDETESMCVLRPDGRVLCWGQGDQGQLGNGSLNDGSAPTLVPGLADVVQLAAGGYHVCALQVSGRVWCWGRNEQRQVTGTRGLDNIRAPSDEIGVADAVQIAAGGRETCARRASGEVVCWGGGVGASVWVSGATDVEVGEHAWRCAVLGAGDVACTFPMTLVSGLGATQIAVSGDHQCAVLGAATVSCWGRDHEGQVGDGGSLRASVDDPTDVGLTDLSWVGVGTWHSCALSTSGTVWCWGSNGQGQVNGTAVSTQKFPAPIEVPGLAGVTHMTSAYRCNCAQLDAGGLACWGICPAGWELF